MDLIDYELPQNPASLSLRQEAAYIRIIYAKPQYKHAIIRYHFLI